MKRSFLLCIWMMAVWCIAGCAAHKQSQPPASPYAEALLAETETIRIGGGDALLTDLISPLKDTFEEENPSLRLVTVQTKLGTELADLMNGSLDAVVSTIPLTRLRNEAAETLPASAATVLREVAVGRKETVIFVNQGIKTKKLTKKQLKAIFTGKITNWKKVGGANRHIVVVWSKAAVGENDAFIEDVLQRERVVANFLPVATVEEMRTKVQETPGAIGIGPSDLISHGIRVPRSPKITSSVVLITSGEPSPKVRKLLDLIQDVAFLQ